MPRKKAEPTATTALAVVPKQLNEEQQATLIDDIVHDGLLTAGELSDVWSERLGVRVPVPFIRSWMSVPAVQILMDEMLHRMATATTGQNLSARMKLQAKIHAMLNARRRLPMRDMRNISKILADFNPPQPAGGVQVSVATKIELPTHLSDKELLEVAATELKGDTNGRRAEAGATDAVQKQEDAGEGDRGTNQGTET